MTTSVRCPIFCLAYTEWVTLHNLQAKTLFIIVPIINWHPLQQTSQPDQLANYYRQCYYCVFYSMLK